VLLGFSMWWIGSFPEGFVNNVFPPLAKILLQEDDPEVLEVSLPPVPTPIHSFSLFDVSFSMGFCQCSCGGRKDWTKGVEFDDFHGLRPNFGVDLVGWEVWIGHAYVDY
jgi:hypothetical protein